MNALLDRLEFVLALSEQSLRQVLLIPLLTRLGYRELVEYHGGSPEKGKDMIGWYSDPFDHRRHVAFVVKRGDIHGAVAKEGNAAEVLYQLQQAFHEPYRDIYGLSELRIDECVVITSGQIKNTAIESVSGTLAALNLDRCVRFVDGAALVGLITRRMPEYWFNDRLFLALAHELRAPLASIASAASMVHDYFDKYSADPKTLEDLIQRIAADAHVANRLLDRQSFLFRDHLDIRLTQTPVMGEVTKTVWMFEETLGRRTGVTVQIQKEGTPGNASLDSYALRNALLCLLDNAVTFGERGKRIGVFLCEQGKHVIVRVRNWGSGIEPNHEELIFEPLYTRSPNRLGLGLFVARKLIRAMGGDLRLTRSCDPTEFSIYLLRKAKDDTDSGR
jgi:signal transduction histidine kinase